MDPESGTSPHAGTSSIGSDSNTDDSVQRGCNVAADFSRASEDTCRWSGAVIVIVDGVSDLHLTKTERCMWS